MNEQDHSTPTIKFILLPCKGKDEKIIAARILYKRKKALCSMRIKVLPAEWDKVNGRFLPTDKQAQIQNNRLREAAGRLEAIFWRMKEEKAPITAKSIVLRFSGKTADKKQSKRLTEYYKYYVEEITKRPAEFCPAVIKHYKITLSYLVKFLQFRGTLNITLDDLSPAFLEHLEQYLMSTPTNLTGKPMQISTMGRHIKKVRAVVNSAKKREFISHNPFEGYKLKSSKETNRQVLTDEEYDRLISHDLGGNLSLQKLRDCFVFCSETGLRYSDAQQLTEEMIRCDNTGKYWITLKQVKTNSTVEIPLSDLALLIYNKYSSHRGSTGKSLPIVSNQKGNTYFKVIAEIVGTKVFTWHSGRHFFALNALEMGIDIATISALLGHRSIRTTMIYLKISRARKAKVLDVLNMQSARRKLLYEKISSPSLN